jgi:hypothetical protein
MLPLLDGRPLTAWASKPVEALSTQEVQAGLTLVGSIADSLPQIALDLFKQVGLYAVTATPADPGIDDVSVAAELRRVAVTANAVTYLVTIGHQMLLGDYEPKTEVSSVMFQDNSTSFATDR